MMILSYGVSWVSFPYPLDDRSPKRLLMRAQLSEHARLKDHVNAMPGRLEAAIREGGTSPDSPGGHHWLGHANGMAPILLRTDSDKCWCRCRCESLGRSTSIDLFSESATHPH